MGLISYKKFENLVKRHGHYINEDTDNWRSCKASICSETVGEMIVREAYLPDSSFKFTTFNGTTFINTNFERADFSDCNFYDCNFIGCNFNNAIFTNSRFTECRFTGSRLNFCVFTNCSISDSNAMSDDIIEELGYEMLRTINIIGSTFKQCIFTSAFAEYVYFVQNSVNLCHFSRCDFSLVNIRGDYSYRDNRTDFSNCDFHDNGNKNIPDLPMACPRVGSFIAYKKVNVGYNYFDDRTKANIGSTAIVVLQIPASAKRSSANSKKCRCSKAKVLRFETLEGERIRDPKKYNFISMHDADFEYVVGKTVTPALAFNTDRWTECASGIHFFMNREDAVFY